MGLECHLHVFYKIMLCLVALKKDIVWPHETVAVATTNGAIEHDFIKHIHISLSPIKLSKAKSDFIFKIYICKKIWIYSLKILYFFAKVKLVSLNYRESLIYLSHD
jgi:hypothetical protein